MTKQEFVKKEANKFSKDTTLHGIKLFSDGLTKGLEIAKEFAEWVDNVYTQDVNGSWKSWDENHDVETQTTDELLEIFLTEKYGQ